MQKNVAIIFDMDGVIVDSNPFHKVSLQFFVRRHGRDLSEDDLKKHVYGRTNREWLTNVFGLLSPEDMKAYAEEKEKIYREMYRAYIKPIDGLREFLDLMNQYGIERAIGTSAPPANVNYTMSGTDLRDYFPIILDETFVTRGKPDPEIYQKCAAALQRDPSECIVIEDSLSGIESARAAGCRVVGITTTHTAAELAHADYVISNYIDLDPLHLITKATGVS